MEVVLSLSSLADIALHLSRQPTCKHFASVLDVKFEQLLSIAGNRVIGLSNFSEECSLWNDDTPRCAFVRVSATKSNSPPKNHSLNYR
jgi:hypothetical protein